MTPAPAMPSESGRLGERLNAIVREMREAEFRNPSTRKSTWIRTEDALAHLVSEERAAARLEALEEAAKVAIDYINCDCGGFCECYGRGSIEKIAARIRSLSAPPQKTQEET